VGTTKQISAGVDDYVFAAHEQPMFPGSPYTPQHTPLARVAYGLAAILLGISATLGNALVTVNLNTLPGSMGLYATEAAWMTAVFVALNAGANLLLVKARIQFGVPEVTRVLLVAYAIGALLQAIQPSFALELVVRAASGLAAAGLTTMGVYHWLQAFPAKIRPAALVAGIVVSQLGVPLARLVPVEMLGLGSWRGLSMIELALALAALAAIRLQPLPPSVCKKAFEPLDLLSISLLLPALLLLCGVLAQGRLLWWTDTPWLGWALSAAVLLFTLAMLIERGRSRPLLFVAWLSSRDILRFAAIALLVRLALSEHSYGAVGFLTSSGLNNDQLHILFSLVIAGMVLGGLVAIATLSVPRLPVQVMAAALVIALAAWLDSQSNNLTGPVELYFTQFLLGFGTTLFLGPALVYGFGRMMLMGPDYLVSFFVLFNLTQNLGGLAGAALMSSLQAIAARSYSQSLAEHLLAGDPQVAARLLGGAGALGQTVAREANVLAFNAIFQLIAALALLTAAYLAFRIVRLRIIQAQEARP